jgi:hypothetical protein
MSEIKLTQGEIGVANQRPSELTWPRVLTGIGCVLLLVDVGVSAAAKGALGELPKYVAFAAVLLLATAGIGGIIRYLGSRSDRRA